MPPRKGSAMWRIEDGGMFNEERVGSDVDGKGGLDVGLAVRCFPACTKRMSEMGAEVRRDRSCWSVEREVSEGIIKGIAEVH